MTDQPGDDIGGDAAEKPAAAASPLQRNVRRTMLSTGFSDLPGKVCAVCGFEGFRWQTACPQGHPLT